MQGSLVTNPLFASKPENLFKKIFCMKAGKVFRKGGHEQNTFLQNQNKILRH